MISREASAFYDCFKLSIYVLLLVMAMVGQRSILQMYSCSYIVCSLLLTLTV